MNNVIYMEVDSFDGKYRPSNEIINSNDYFLGDLVIFSNNDKPNNKYAVKCHFNERIVYDSIVKVGRYKRGYCFKLVFTESQLKTNSPIYFYGKRIKNIESQFKYSWVLQESSNGSKMLDSLELRHEYNPLGETMLFSEQDT